MTNLTSQTLATPNFPPVKMLAIYDGGKTNWMEQCAIHKVVVADQSLTCFAPGNFLLGGRALGREDIFTYGLEILEGCWRAYNATPTGIAPEGIKCLGLTSHSSVAMGKR
jgi:hypothetical protein